MIDPDLLAANIATTQHGVITHAQALACGLTDHQLKQRVRSGRWERITRGVYAVRGAPPSWRRATLAACLGAPPGTVASHLSAAALYDLRPPPAHPHVTVPYGLSARLPIARVHRTRLSPLDVVERDRIMCTTPARTMVDVAGMLGRTSLEHVVDTALHGALTDVSSVVQAADRAGPRRGSKLLSDLLDPWLPGIEPGSPAEVRLLRLLDAWGYEKPESQIRIYDAAGDEIARADLGWSAVRLGLEYDSDRWHGPRRWLSDELRQRAVEATGWCLLRPDKTDLRAGERSLRDRLAHAWHLQSSRACA